MEFRDWLLNEDPDELRRTKDASGAPITFRSGVTFTLLDGYYLSQKSEGWVMHEVIARHVWECRDAITSALEGRGPAGDVDRCLGFSVNTDGRIGDKSLRQLSDTAAIMDFKDDYEQGKKKFVAYRTLTLNEHPDIILGRFWAKHRVISFWNSAANLRERKRDIYAFMASRGMNPSEFTFEVQNEPFNYEEFEAGRKSGDNDFDPAKIHTMLPGEQKTRLMNAMGFLKSKPVDARYRRDGD
jgi:hypothetical protein